MIDWVGIVVGLEEEGGGCRYDGDDGGAWWWPKTNRYAETNWTFVGCRGWTRWMGWERMRGACCIIYWWRRRGGRMRPNLLDASSSVRWWERKRVLYLSISRSCSIYLLAVHVVKNWGFFSELVRQQVEICVLHNQILFLCMKKISIHLYSVSH